MEKITLFQPRHTAASSQRKDFKKGHIYLPSSLSTAGARILAAGGDIEMQDGNIRRPNFQTNIIGANVVGPPYIPIAIELREEITTILGEDAKLILGGQVISGLSEEQFKRLFGKNSFNGNDDAIIKKLLGLKLKHMPPSEETSLIPAYEKISDEDFKEYMEHEFCLYLSQGCKFGCKFCAANRTFKDPVTGKLTEVTERYRNLEIVEKELKYMVERAKKLGVKSFNIYLSNLDTFQTPDKLKEFAKIIIGIKTEHADFTLKLRGLSTGSEFIKTYTNNKETIELMVQAGLWSIGFGVDGTSKKVWRSIKKGHNNLDECIEAIRLTREEFGITPEIFMVIGHEEDTPEVLAQDIEFTIDMVDRFGATPRPYVAKNIVPGNSGWKDPKNQEYVEKLIEHPDNFFALEYGALPSPLTHPNSDMREAIKNAFHMLASIPGNTTEIIYPISADIKENVKNIYRRLNEGKFDR